MDRIAFIERLTGELRALLPEHLGRLNDDLRENVKVVVTGTLADFDLVTREEFDAQRALLLRTRERVAELERIVSELEST